MAGISPQTASGHLARLVAGELIEPETQGRHRYYRLSGPDVAGMLEGLGASPALRSPAVRTGPKEPALRRARTATTTRRRARRADARRLRERGWSRHPIAG